MKGKDQMVVRDAKGCFIFVKYPFQKWNWCFSMKQYIFEQITSIIIDGNSMTHDGSHGNVAVIENSDQCLQSGESIANGGQNCNLDSKYCSQFC